MRSGWSSSSAPRPSACGCRRSTPPACGSSAPTPIGSGTASRFTIYDDADSRRLIEHIVRDLDIDAKKLPARGRSRAPSRRPRPSWPTSRPTSASGAASVFERRIADVYARVPAAAARPRRPWTSTTCCCSRCSSSSAPGRPRRLPDAVHAHPRRRVPGHQPGPERARAHAGRPSTTTSAWSATATSPSTGGAAPTSATSWNSKRPSPTRRSSRSSRTTGRPRRSSTPPTPSSPTTSPGVPKELWTDGEAGGPDRALPGRGRARRGGLGRHRDRPAAASSTASTTATWPSSTAPTPRAGPSRRSSCAPASRTRWWAGRASTTGARSRTSSPTCACSATPPTRCRPGASSTCRARGVGDASVDRLAPVGARQRAARSSTPSPMPPRPG